MTKQEIRDYNCGNLSWVKSLTKQQDEGAWGAMHLKVDQNFWYSYGFLSLLVITIETNARKR